MAMIPCQGINQVIVAVNKLDTSTPVWSKERYHQIEREMKVLLMEFSFKEKAIHVVPISGLSGENLFQISEECPLKSWYHGSTLMDCLDHLKIPTRPVNRPLRALVTKPTNECSRDHYVKVSVLQGSIKINRSINISMNLGVAIVTQIQSHDGAVLQELRAGQRGTIGLLRR